MKIPFKFLDVANLAGLKATYVIEIGPGIAAKTELLKKVASEGGFPDYFGENWDALSDCLRDLSWIPEEHVVILHHDVPLKHNSSECYMYLDILKGAVLSWAEYANRVAQEKSLYGSGNHVLDVIFPSVAKSFVEGVLSK